MYFVYKYWFEDGTVYFGRTKEGADRFCNPGRYKDQEVYKHLTNPQQWDPSHASIVYRSDNLFEICYIEHKMIKEHYENSHNGSQEDSWFIKAVKEYGLNYWVMRRDLREFEDKYPGWESEEIMEALL